MDCGNSENIMFNWSLNSPESDGCPLCYSGRGLKPFCTVKNGKMVSGMFVKLKCIVLNDHPKCRSEEARECGSEKLAQLAGPANAGEKSRKSCERWKCRTSCQNVRNDCKTEKHCAQRHSKVSELAVQNDQYVP